ncbi:MAG: AlbA family DNA-binding domain-containing protein [Promethearchaeota archaeon]
MINKKFDEIEESDLQYLIDNGVLESKTLEYKAKLPGFSDSEKKEFLADISAFANASGGDLIYGINEDKNTGAPQGPLQGLEIQNVDELKLRLEQLLRTGLEPPLPSSVYNIRSIDLSNGKKIIIFRISRSWLGPHRISFKNSHKFYSRHSSGKYLLDIQELRSLIILSETITEKIKYFKQERLSMIIEGETTLRFYNKEILILHLIPISSFSAGQHYDLNLIYQNNSLIPLHSNSWNLRFNLDGLLAFNKLNFREIPEITYVQLFRNGIIEAAEDYLFQIANTNGEKNLPLNEIEAEIIKKIPYYLNILRDLSINPPIFISLNLIGIKDFRYVTKIPVEVYPVDRDLLILPDVILEDYNDDLGKILKPCFDSMWNAIGFSGSPNYDRDGKWNAP